MNKILLTLLISICLIGVVSAAGGTGGTITTDGQYYIHTFTSNGTFTWTGATTNITFLMVGGGGAGGQDTIGAAGGGGAGGYIFNLSANITAAAYLVNIGLGGNSSGANTSFNFTTLQAAGGGIGAFYPGSTPSSGGSGGGAAQNGAAGASGTSTQGFAGGSGGVGAGGGGGSCNVGASNSGSNGGAGGNGCYNSINGTNFTWAGGGGAKGNSGGSDGSGGTGGGGNAGVGGRNNTGGGGGGGGEGTSMGVGGAGVVIIRYTNLTSLEVHLVSPLNNTNSPSQNNSFVSNIYNSTGTIAVTNVSFYLNGTINQTNTSQRNGTYNFTVNLPRGFWNWTVVAYGNDTNSYSATNGTFNLNVVSVNFFNFTYENQTLEQSSTTLRTNFTIGSNVSISSVNLTYNQTNYSASITSVNSTYYHASVTLTTPAVNSNTNMTFNWTAYLTDGTSATSSNNLQTIINLGIDDCSSGTIQIFNFTLKNEATQVNLTNSTDNTTIRVDIDFYPNGSLTVPTFEFSKFYNQTLPARVCVNSALGSTVFFTNTQIQYDADGYVNEFYNIQNYSLNASSNPSQNITLYDLADTQSTSFTISYKDSSFLPVTGALIQVQRKYVDEGVFKVVEIPMTDTNGEAVAHLVIDDVIYSFTVVKNGQILATFSSQNAICQNPSISTCTIDLTSTSSSIDVTDFSSTLDFEFTLTYNNNTRIISSTFTIPSGAVGLVSLNVTQQDALGTTVCSEQVTTSAGTLNCVVGSNFGNGTVIAKLYKNNVLQAQGTIKLDQEPADIYGGSVIVLGLFIMLTLIGAGLSDNPIITISFLMVGVILLYALNLVANNGFIGATSTILWLIIAFVLIMVKAGRRS